MYIVFNGAQEINLEDELFLRSFFLLAATFYSMCFFMLFLVMRLLISQPFSHFFFSPINLLLPF